MSSLSKRDLLAIRNAEMLELRNAGWSLEAIGQKFPYNGKPMSKFGVSLCIQRAVDKGGVLKIKRGKTPNRENSHSVRQEGRKKRARELYLAGESFGVISSQLGVSEKTIRQYCEGLVGVAKFDGPVKSVLSYEEIFRLFQSGVDIEDIAVDANITSVRVRQIIQRMGHYVPRPETLEVIRAVVGHVSNGVYPRKVAELLGISVSQVYRYTQLGRGLGLFDE